MPGFVKAGIRAVGIRRAVSSAALAAAIAIATIPLGSVQAAPQSRASEFYLPNGMQVVVVPDTRAPVVTHVVWYRVGGADNALGQSGLAHFLEHLMFRSTKKLKSGELARTVSRLGGRDNAVTSHDATYYFQRLPKEHLKTAMVMEADRMRNLQSQRCRGCNRAGRGAAGAPLGGRQQAARDPRRADQRPTSTSTIPTASP